MVLIALAIPPSGDNINKYHLRDDEYVLPFKAIAAGEIDVINAVMSYLQDIVIPTDYVSG